MIGTVFNLAGRSATGKSRPFLCECEDGNFYYVKSENVDWRGLVVEYLISSLASEFGLPTAPFSLVEIPEDLPPLAVVENAFEFQPGIGFASRRVPFAEQLRVSHLQEIGEEEKLRCLCFDWWVRNGDRKLDRLGGDPNILWDPVMQSCVVIDFDEALSEDFSKEEFFAQHPFRDARSFLEADHLKRLRTSFESAIYNLDKTWEKIPQEWLVDPSGEPRIDFAFHDVEAVLLKPELPVDAPLPVQPVS